MEGSCGKDVGVRGKAVVAVVVGDSKRWSYFVHGYPKQLVSVPSVHNIKFFTSLFTISHKPMAHSVRIMYP